MDYEFLAKQTSKAFASECKELNLIDRLHGNPGVAVDILIAARSCDIPIDSIFYAYEGSWSTNEDFIKFILQDDLPELPSYIYIDWEKTSDAMMKDYKTDLGHYFRTFEL